MFFPVVDLSHQYINGLKNMGFDTMLTETAIVPVLCGSATTPIATDQLAEFICRGGPAPGDQGPTPVDTPAGPEELLPDPGRPPVVVVFKTTFDEFIGQISMFKVLSGTVRVDDVLVNQRSGSKERLHNLISLTGSSQAHVDGIGAGDIGAVTKLTDTRTGDTLTVEGASMTAIVPRLPRRGETQGHSRALDGEGRPMGPEGTDGLRETVVGLEACQPVPVPEGGGRDPQAHAVPSIRRATFSREPRTVRSWRDTSAGRGWDSAPR